jgi:hypothetical protein
MLVLGLASQFENVANLVSIYLAIKEQLKLSRWFLRMETVWSLQYKVSSLTQTLKAILN